MITAAYSTENGKVKDDEFLDFITSEMEKGHSFFHYHSDNPSTLSSCCRLANKIEVNPFAYSLGGTGVMTGSIKGYYT